MKRLKLIYFDTGFSRRLCNRRATSQIHTGMTKDEVTNILGNPDESERHGAYRSTQIHEIALNQVGHGIEQIIMSFLKTVGLSNLVGMVRKDFDPNILFIVPLQ